MRRLLDQTRTEETGAIMVVVALYYYLLIIKAMYMEEPNQKEPAPIPVPTSAKWVLISCTAAILILGIFQGPFVTLTNAVAKSLF